MHSTRNERRAAHDLKRGGETAYGVAFTRPIRAAGRHFNAANDEDGGCGCCLICGREGHSSDECTRPVPAWPAGLGEVTQ